MKHISYVILHYVMATLCDDWFSLQLSILDEESGNRRFYLYIKHGLNWKIIHNV